MRQISSLGLDTGLSGNTFLRRHAEASSATVVLDYGDPARVALTIQDYGVGTDDPGGGYGLLGIRERVKLLGGQVRVDTAPGQGFRLEVEVPT